MKAAILEELNRIEVKEVETPQPKQGEVLLKVKACAVCGSDIRIYHYGNPRVNPPQIIGHEIAGEVSAIGKDIEKFKIGDRLAIGADVPCGLCDFCRQGRGNNCSINYAMGYQFPGGFAEYVLLNEVTVKYGPVHKIPANLSFEEASLAEPLACCLNGLEMVNFRPGESVVIIGAGPIGCLLAELAKSLGAGRVIIATRSKEKLDMAKKFRIDAFISVKEEDIIERVRRETDGEGADIVFTACASAQAQEEAVYLVRNRGRINFFGGLPKGSSRVALDTNLIHYKELSLSGSHGSVPRQHKLALNILSHTIKAKEFISHRFSLNEISQAFELVEKGKRMKVVIIP